MFSFYGGKQGKDFRIKHIFKSRYGIGFDSLENDLRLGWTSEIAAEDYVVISYGKIGEQDSEYNTNRTRDEKVDGINYNSTLWEKVYDEVTGLNTGGFSYRLISQMTGNTPNISIKIADQPLDADEEPYIEYNNKNIDSPSLILHLPQSQVFEVKDLVLKNAKTDPELVYDNTNINRPTLTFKLPRSQVLRMLDMIALPAGQSPQVIYDDTTDVNNPSIQFKIPKSQKLSLIQGDILNADQNPQVIYDDTTNINEPTIKINLPRSQVFNIIQGSSLDADQEPKMTYDDTQINSPEITFQLPVSQVIQDAIVEEVLEAGESPEVRLDTTSEGSSVNKPILKFKLPKTQQFIKSNVTSNSIDADQSPTVDFDETTDPSKPKLVFSIPVAQVMAAPESETVGPQIDPSVQLSDTTTVNNPKLKFNLPRAVKFYSGTALTGNDPNESYTLNNNNYLSGDYYININNGFIYKIESISEDGATVTAKYITCIIAPIPEITTSAINPYTDNGNINNPLVERELTNNGWKLNFSLPQAPSIGSSFSFVGPSESGEVQRTISSSGVTFAFKIPTGSRFYTGTDIASPPTQARPGDLYLNVLTGEVYALFDDGIWAKQAGTLKGPTGEALAIAQNFVTTLSEDTLENGVNYIKSQLGSSYIYKNEEIFGFTQVTEEGNIAYWYYCFNPTNDSWGRVQLTGNAINYSIEESFYDGEETKTYSTSYINSLINSNDQNKISTAYSKEKIDSDFAWGQWDTDGNIKLT